MVYRPVTATSLREARAAVRRAGKLELQRVLLHVLDSFETHGNHDDLDPPAVLDFLNSIKANLRDAGMLPQAPKES